MLWDGWELVSPPPPPQGGRLESSGSVPEDEGQERGDQRPDDGAPEEYEAEQEPT